MLSVKSPATLLRATRLDSPWRSCSRAWATRASWRARTWPTTMGSNRLAAAGRCWGHRLAGFGFILGSGLTSLFVVPVLGLLALVLGLAAPVVVVLGVLRFLGASWISIRLLPDTELPQVWSVPVTLAFALICVALAWGAAKLLRLYVRAILAGYRRVLPSVARV